MHSAGLVEPVERIMPQYVQARAEQERLPYRAPRVHGSTTGILHGIPAGYDGRGRTRPRPPHAGVPLSTGLLLISPIAERQRTFASTLITEPDSDGTSHVREAECRRTGREGVRRKRPHVKIRITWNRTRQSGTSDRDPDMKMVSAAPARAAGDRVPGVSGTKKMPG